MSDLSRLLSPKSLAVVGGGTWCVSVLEQARRINPDVALYPVHPSKSEIAGIRAYPSVKHLPDAPDATFIGINRDATIGVVERLQRMQAGGAVCFASGFAEAQAEDITGRDAQERLRIAAKEMPILGPNCYGFINALDQMAVWPDQHGLIAVDSGVAILTQSSNIAINLTMQKRGLPIAYMITCGNQAQTSQAEIALALLDDPRVTAIGLHIEGFGTSQDWHALAVKAQERSIPLIALKLGQSEHARAATVSHTASMSGADAGAQALLDRMGIPRVFGLPEFLETLKLAHFEGRLASSKIASISCSGGEASLVADMAQGRAVSFPELSKAQVSALRDVLGPDVALSNPLDYHTFIWRDASAMSNCWSAMATGDVAVTLIVADFPRSDRCDPSDWDCVITSAIETRRRSEKPVLLTATLGELLPEEIGKKLIDGGVVPVLGIAEALCATEALSMKFSGGLEPIHPISKLQNVRAESEASVKSELSSFGLSCPRSIEVPKLADFREDLPELSFPLVLKASGVAHKSDMGGVVLDLQSNEQLYEAAAAMPHNGPYLVEEMIPSGVELLVGFLADPPHGVLMTLAPGGVYAELMDVTAHALLPISRDHILTMLKSLRIWRLLDGYRGKPGCDIDACVAAIDRLQDFVISHSKSLQELEVNPLICTAKGAFVADALMSRGSEND
ncbi:MAG: acetate--CoA ligase family protein [Pseudomonadota bacterium]